MSCSINVTYLSVIVSKETEIANDIWEDISAASCTTDTLYRSNYSWGGHRISKSNLYMYLF